MAVRMLVVGRLASNLPFLSRVTPFARSQCISLNRFHVIAALSDATKIHMPSLSPTMQQGTIIKWYKKEGDAISPGDLLCDIQTDKAVVGFEVEEEGILAKILKPDNSPDVQIGSLIALIVESGADWTTVTVPTETPTKESSAPSVTESKSSSGDVQHHSSGHKIHPVGPAVRLLLEQYNLKQNVVTSTGPHNRLLKGDVLAFIKSQNLSPVRHEVVAPQPAPVVPSASKVLAQPATSKSVKAAKSTMKGATFVDTDLTNMRSVIAKRLTMSKQTIPHSYATVDCNIDRLMETRKQLANDGIKVGVNDFIIKAAAVALQRVPEVNAIWSEDAPRLLSNIDISVAVATDNGLITPIVKNAVGLGVNEISVKVKDLASRARAGKLKLDEFQGGSFTISNLGMFGITSFSAVVNPPQACILAVGASRPVAHLNDDDTVSSTTVVTMTTSCDGRIVNDATAADFLNTLRDILENPSLMLSHHPPAVSESRYDLQKLFAK